MLFLTASKIKLLALQLSTFLIFYFISMVILDRSFYLFRWTADNRYIYIWVIVIILTLKDKKIVALSITLGNMTGIIIGQFLGDYIKYINQAKITDDTSPEIVWSLVETHRGFQIWIMTLLIFIICGFLIQKLKTRLSTPSYY